MYFLLLCVRLCSYKLVTIHSRINWFFDPMKHTKGIEDIDTGNDWVYK